MMKLSKTGIALKLSNPIGVSSGFVLPLSVMMLGLLSVLVGGYLMVVTSQLQLAKHWSSQQAADVLCEVGVAQALNALTANSNWSTGFSNVEYPSGSGNTYSLTVARSGATATLDATSVAYASYLCHIRVTVMVPPTPSISRPVRIDRWERL